MLPINLTAVLCRSYNAHGEHGKSLCAGRITRLCQVRSTPAPGRFHVLHSASWITVPVVLGVLAKESGSVAAALCPLCGSLRSAFPDSRWYKEALDSGALYAVILGAPIAAAAILDRPELDSPGHLGDPRLHVGHPITQRTSRRVGLPGLDRRSIAIWPVVLSR